MKKVISEKVLMDTIKNCINEALKYDKDLRQYHPDYTGNAHSDAGKYVSNNRDEPNYSRNDYQWLSQQNQRRFNRLQSDNDLEIDPFDPDRDNESRADEYLYSQQGDNIVQRAANKMSGDFNAFFNNFLENAKQQYPILKNHNYMSDFILKMRDCIDDFDI